MGNCKSCIESIPQTATVIDEHGRLCQIKVPMTAAEIILDELGHVITSEQLIRRTHRVTLMKADDELRPGHIYLLYPTARLNSRVTKSEMKLLNKYAMGSKRRRCKILSTKTKIANTVDRPVSQLGELGTGFTDGRVSYSCPWRPVLDPIIEENGTSKVNHGSKVPDSESGLLCFPQPLDLLQFKFNNRSNGCGKQSNPDSESGTLFP